MQVNVHLIKFLKQKYLKDHFLYNKHIKCRKSTEIVKNCTASADEPVERQTKES